MIAGRILTRDPEAAGDVVLVGSSATAARDWLRMLFPTVPFAAVGTDAVERPDAVRLVRAAEQARHLATADVTAALPFEEPW